MSTEAFTKTNDRFAYLQSTVPACIDSRWPGFASISSNSNSSNSSCSSTSGNNNCSGIPKYCQRYLRWFSKSSMLNSRTLPPTLCNLELSSTRNPRVPCKDRRIVTLKSSSTSTAVMLFSSRFCFFRVRSFLVRTQRSFKRYIYFYVTTQSAQTFNTFIRPSDVVVRQRWPCFFCD